MYSDEGCMTYENDLVAYYGRKSTLTCVICFLLGIAGHGATRQK